jgi:hypothetical protein
MTPIHFQAVSGELLAQLQVLPSLSHAIIHPATKIEFVSEPSCQGTPQTFLPGTIQNDS